MPGRVAFVNVGTVREIVHRGRPRTTAIYKEPVARRLHLGTERVEGDAQADLSVHGGPDKAVYAYAQEDYAWWARSLGADLADLGPGTFGENLTTSGIDLSEVRIGEQFQVGTALLQAVQPRVPCWKLGFRMGDPTFPRRFLEAARTGAYFAVIQEGEVGAGDEWVPVMRPEHPVTIGLIAQLNDTNRPLVGALLEAVRIGLDPQQWAQVLAGVAAPPEALP